MGYIEVNLLSGEKVILRGRPHWVVFLEPALIVPAVIVLVIILLIIFPNSTIGSLFACLGLLMLLAAVADSVKVGARSVTTEFALTDKRVIAKAGLLRRRSLEILWTKVESIRVNQPLLGRLLDYGTIVVVGTGGTAEPFPFISTPTFSGSV